MHDELQCKWQWEIGSVETQWRVIQSEYNQSEGVFAAEHSVLHSWQVQRLTIAYEIGIRCSVSQITAIDSSEGL